MGCSQSQTSQETKKPAEVTVIKAAPPGNAAALTRTSSKYDSIGDSDLSPSSKTLSKTTSFKELKGLSIGQRLLCRDEFRSKYTGEWMAKWRNVEIIDLSLESKRIFVHFEGWSDSFDIWVDLTTELHKICALELLTKEERDKGISLDNSQLKQMQTYIHTGDFLPRTVSKKLSFKNENTADTNKPGATANTLSPPQHAPPAYTPSATTPYSHTPNPSPNPNAGYHSAAPQNPIPSSNPPPSEPAPSSSGAVIPVGTLLDVLDIYYKKGSDQVSYKWRKARVVEFQFPKIRVNYLGWDASFDESLDIMKDTSRIAEFGTKTNAQLSRGVVLQRVGVGELGGGVGGGERVSPARASADQERASSSELAPTSYPVVATAPTGVKTQQQVVASAQPSAQPHTSNTNHAQANNTSSHTLPRTLTPLQLPPKEVVQEEGENPPSSATPIPNTSTRQTFSIRNPFKFLKSDATTANPSADASSQPATASSATDGAPSLASSSRDIFKRIFKFIQGESGSGRKGGDDKRNSAVVGAINDWEKSEEEQVATVLNKSAEEMKAEIEREKKFIEALGQIGLHVIEIEGDGNCLFRAVSHQLTLREDFHDVLRKRCVAHLRRHRARFAPYIFGDFDEYAEEMETEGTWGDDVEIRVLEEVIDRHIHIYSSCSDNPTQPIKSDEGSSLPISLKPLCLSYHGGRHYNSLYNEAAPLPLPLRRGEGGTGSVLMKERVRLFREWMGEAGAPVGGTPWDDRVDGYDDNLEDILSGRVPIPNTQKPTPRTPGTGAKPGARTPHNYPLPAYPGMGGYGGMVATPPRRPPPSPYYGPPGAPPPYYPPMHPSPYATPNSPYYPPRPNYYPPRGASVGGGGGVRYSPNRGIGPPTPQAYSYDR